MVHGLFIKQTSNSSGEYFFYCRRLKTSSCVQLAVAVASGTVLLQRDISDSWKQCQRIPGHPLALEMCPYYSTRISNVITGRQVDMFIDREPHGSLPDQLAVPGVNMDQMDVMLL